MKANELRYIAVAMVLSAGVALGIAIPVGEPVGPWLFTAYMTTFYMIYQNTEWLNEAIEWIANGRERKK